MKDYTVLTDFRPVKYPKIPQKVAIEKFISSISEAKGKSLSQREIKKVEKYALSEDKIKQRSVLRYSEGFSNDWNDIILRTLSEEFKNRKAPDAMIFATGSLFDIPSPLQKFLSNNNWLNTIPYNSFNFGCAGAFPALEIADSSIKNKDLEIRTLEIFNTDIISRHFDRIAKNLSQDLRVEGIIISTLFGDSSIFYTAMREEEFQKQKRNGLRVLTTYRKTIPDSVSATTWLDHKSADFKLSPLIPDYAGENFLDFLEPLCNKAGINFKEQKDTLAYALHPGGSKILDKIQEGCDLSDESIANSRQLLYENGNTSSASCPTLWSQIVEDKNIPYGKKIVSVGLGPGLMIGGAILEKIKPEYSQ